MTEQLHHKCHDLAACQRYGESLAVSRPLQRPVALLSHKIHNATQFVVFLLFDSNFIEAQ